jgi:hypothetical protein
MGGGGKGGGGGGSTVVGYKYYWGMHLVLAHSVSAVLELRFGDRLAWTGYMANGYSGVENPDGSSPYQYTDVDAGDPVPPDSELLKYDKTWETGIPAGSTTQPYAPVPGYMHLDATTLFSNNEGGVAGRVDFLSGSQTQPRHPYLYSRVSHLVSAARRVASLVFRRCYMGNNPYMRKLGVKAVRLWPADPDENWAVVGESAVPYDGMSIGAHDYDMNPAHIIYECLVNRDWGRGLAASDIDLASFTAAATRLYDESFGLSILWNRENSVEDFIKTILEHIDGLLYEVPSSGKVGIRLLRGDYTVGSLPVLGPDQIESVEQYYRPGWGAVTNKVFVVWKDDMNNEKTVYAKDQAAINMQGSVVSETLSMPGIRHVELAQRVADRELAQRTGALAQVTVVAVRDAAKDLLPGSVFVWQWPEYGVVSMVLRVLKAEHGPITGGTVRLTCTQDVFAEPVISGVAAPTPVPWTPPGGEPQAATLARINEAPYWFVIQYLTGEYSFLLAEFDDDSAAAMVMAVSPQADSGSFSAVFDAGAGYDEDAGLSGVWCPGGTVTAAMTSAATTLTVASPSDFQLVKVGQLLFVDDEIMLVQGVSGYTVTVARGVLDTVPQAHAAGAACFFAVSPLLPKTEYATGETVATKLLTQTVGASLDIDDAPAMSVTMASRFARPYPPGKVRVNGEAWPASITGDLVLTWASRNRTQQTAYIVTQDEDSVTPEAGTTYNVRIYGENAQLLRTVTGITGTSYTYPEADEVADGGLNRRQTALTVARESERDGLVSWQAHQRSFTRPDVYAVTEAVVVSDAVEA